MLAEIATKHEAELREQEQKDAEMLRDVQSMVQRLVDELRQAHATIAELRAMLASNPHRESPPPPERATTVESPAALEPRAAAPTPDRVSHLQAVYSELLADERKQFSSIVATWPRPELAKLEERLVSVDPPNAAEYLRHELFPSLASPT
jgi:hypothetical protein